jgi:hypothetical protein
MNTSLTLTKENQMDTDTTFAKEIAKSVVASAAISAATTAGFWAGLLGVAVVVQKVTDRKKK